ncbi:type III-B CRISPR-associated protein Cas10/Cmr2 [Chamaesiphon sp.]|uniref:type III-B CRISPR-associated protein Cas10/Cmr2 n=1 Tax=Chamaesiphon sp. TaxID=2814140 RepID=UPI003593938F
MQIESTDRIQRRIKIAIAWCLGYSPTLNRGVQLQALRDRFYGDLPCSDSLQSIVDAVVNLMREDLELPKQIVEIQSLIQDRPLLWEQRIGMVYGGATKIKQYVFEAAKLQEIRGASALLDNINLVDLPAFFHGDEDLDPEYFPECQSAKEYCQKIRHEWLETDSSLAGLAYALIPELIIYSTGGNILAFCPSEVVDRLANAIEKRYTSETLTANSCAVGAIFKPLEIKFGLLPDEITDETFWFADYQKAYQNPETQKFISGYVAPQLTTADGLWEAFCQRKSFNELTSNLAVLFNQRRSGNPEIGRPSRQFPVMFETHPYLRRDGGDKRSAIAQVKLLPDEPWYSESAARKRLVGQIAKREDITDNWYRRLGLQWRPNSRIETWVRKYERFLSKQSLIDRYFEGKERVTEEARSLREIGNVCRGFVAYIYADGNNMGGYIQKIKTPQEYQKFSRDIFTATEQSVYKALAEHLHPHRLQGLTDPESEGRNGKWIHPFEIITIGGDDVMLVVPADKALAISKTLGEEFEKHLAGIPEYQISGDEDRSKIHRYQPTTAEPSASSLSMSTGVLITAETTPIYYAEDLTNQLLKSAKERSKLLKPHGYYGGTVDFLVLKSVTMISSNIKEFRQEGLVKSAGDLKLKFYAAPYTLHELGGLIEVVQTLRTAEFPKSQLYQIRSLLDRGKRTAILNYRYFRVRLKPDGQKVLKDQFEFGWCDAETNNGSLAPWMYYTESDAQDKSGYETIWRDLVDLYDFVTVKTENATQLNR